MDAAAPDCFALLDDREATVSRPTSRLYQGFEREHRCADPAGLDAMWARVDGDLRAGLHAVLLVDYEWGAKLLKAGHERLGLSDASALRVMMFRELSRLSATEVSDRLAGLDAGHSAATGVLNLASSVGQGEFTRAIARIHEAIAAGETYQVNYTYRLRGQAYGAPVALYRRLRER
ncbi:MAG TPA: chloride transporter, partial [Burkholderiaceae bacterium]